MNVFEEQSVHIGDALQACGWFIWRDFLDMKDFDEDAEEYLEDRAERLCRWIAGKEKPPTDYCACYEQVCDFAAEVGDFASFDDMRSIVKRLETMDSAQRYEKRIQDLLSRFDMKDSSQNRMLMDRVYAASVCFSTYQGQLSMEIFQGMQRGDAVVDPKRTKAIDAIKCLHSNVVQYAADASSQASATATAMSPRDNAQDSFSRSQLRRKTTRKNLSQLEEKAILMKKEEMDPQKKSNRSKRSRKKDRNIEPKERVKAKGTWGRRRMSSMSNRFKKSHKKSASEAGSSPQKQRRLHGFNLSESALEAEKTIPEADPSTPQCTDQAWSKSYSEQEERGSHASSSNSHGEEAEAFEDPASEEDDESWGRDEMFFRHLTKHFVRSAWNHIKTHGRSAGMQEFLANYRFPKFTLMTSQDVRVDEVARALGSCAEKNFIRQVIQKVCADNFVVEEVGLIRDKMAGDKPWTSQCDHHTMLAALFWRCGMELQNKHNYLAMQALRNIKEVGSNPELRAFVIALSRSYEEYDESIEDLRFEYHTTSSASAMGARSRSTGQVPAL